MNNQFDAKKIPKFLYLLLGTIIAIVLFMIFVGSPLIQNAGSMQKEHQDTQNLIRDYDNALAQEKTIEDEIKKNQDEFKLKEEELFVDVDTCSKEIEAYCREQDIKLINYSISEPVQDQLSRVSTGGFPVYTVNINISYADTYEKTMSFLKYLENGSNGCYYIKTCNMAQSEDNKNADTFDTSLAIQLYYYNRTIATEPATTAATEAATK